MGLRYGRYQDNGQLTVISGDGDMIAGRLRPRGRSKGKNAPHFMDIDGEQAVLRGQDSPKYVLPNPVIQRPPKPKPQSGRLLSASEHAQRVAERKAAQQTKENKNV